MRVALRYDGVCGFSVMVMFDVLVLMMMAIAVLGVSQSFQHILYDLLIDLDNQIERAYDKGTWSSG
jgi:hypothetical protein